MKGLGGHPLLILLVVSFLWVSEGGRQQRRSEGKFGFRSELLHVDSSLSPYNGVNRTLSSPKWLQRAVQRSHQRSKAISQVPRKRGEMGAPVYLGKGEYLLKTGIGTPPAEFYGILDTGSDLTWTQCRPCEDCYRQSTPIFDPAKSSSYSKVPCRSSLCRALPDHECKREGCVYDYTYGDYSLTEGVLSYETFSFGPSASVPLLAFGCGRTNEGNGFKQAAGIVGFGRGTLSLITQLSYSPNSTRPTKSTVKFSVPKRFSYCLVPVQGSATKQSPLFLGESARLDTKIRSSSTPILINPKASTFYYLSLEGISIGKRRLSIPKGTFEMQEDGSGGFIIDSGTTVTYLADAGYDAVKGEIVSVIKLPKADGSAIGLDVCYRPPSNNRDMPEFPSIVFHFRGADYVMERENYMVWDSGSGLLCLGMLPNTGMSILGNVQQQNFHILYDLQNNLLSFQRTACSAL